MATIASRIAIPPAMKLEHAELHGELEATARAPGRVGQAAHEVARVLHPHFVREEELALPPLGLLVPLAEGRLEADMADVLPLTDELKASLAGMLEEHREIRAAVERLAAVAEEEADPRGARLAEKLMQHASMEEQVTYPAAVLVGELVRLKLGR